MSLVQDAGFMQSNGMVSLHVALTRLLEDYERSIIWGLQELTAPSYHTKPQELKSWM